MFSMLGVNIAYVTAIGRLIGVVGLKELRSGIENANSGAPSKSQTPKANESNTNDGMIINNYNVKMDLFSLFYNYQCIVLKINNLFHLESLGGSTVTQDDAETGKANINSSTD